jgi:hypothetical protein
MQNIKNIRRSVIMKRITLCKSCRYELGVNGRKFTEKPSAGYIACGICRNCNKKTIVDTYEEEKGE